MQDEILAKVLDSDTEIIPRYDIVLPDGTNLATNAQLVLKNQVTQEGTPYNKASVLTDETAALVFPTPPSNPTPDEAFAQLAEQSAISTETVNKIWPSNPPTNPTVDDALGKLADGAAISDETAEKLWPTPPSDPNVNDALDRLSSAVLIKTPTINDFSVGDLVTINETVNDITNQAEFILVSKNYNNTGRALLWRNRSFSQTIYRTGDNVLYSGSNLDNLATTYLSYLDEDVQSQIAEISIPAIINMSTSGNVGTINRKVFSLSATELGFTMMDYLIEGEAIPYFASNEIRKNGTIYWTRTPHTGNLDMAIAVSTSGTSDVVSASVQEYFVPAFTLPLDFELKNNFVLSDTQDDVILDPKELAKIETGSYVGTGTYGVNNPSSLTFSFEPSILIVQKTNQSTYPTYSRLIMQKGMTTVNSGGAAGNDDYIATILEWSKTVYWYSSSAAGQLNQSDTTYSYVAIG